MFTKIWEIVCFIQPFQYQLDFLKNFNIFKNSQSQEPSPVLVVLYPISKENLLQESSPALSGQRNGLGFRATGNIGLGSFHREVTAEMCSFYSNKTKPNTSPNNSQKRFSHKYDHQNLTLEESSKPVIFQQCQKENIFETKS